MKIKTTALTILLLAVLFSCSPGEEKDTEQHGTLVEIRQDKFYINGNPSYENKTWNGFPVEGLLMNSRMVQGLFDDQNPETAVRWKYPDTGEWDAQRNTDEFVTSMEEWYKNGLLAFTINLQGGSPTGYGNPYKWHNSAFDEKGILKEAYFQRLEQVLNKADDLGMVVILGIFYFGQDQFLEDSVAIYNAVDLTFDWLFEEGFRNVLIEINNESDVRAYDHEILKEYRIHELIEYAANKEQNGYRFLVGTSFGGGSIPPENVVTTSDFILIHGNGVSEPERIRSMVNEVRSLPTYTPKPILFNEDDHYNFDQPVNNFAAAIESYASWGYFDYRREGEAFSEGYQSVPVDWGINSERKKAFFDMVREVTGGME